MDYTVWNMCIELFFLSYKGSIWYDEIGVLKKGEIWETPGEYDGKREFNKSNG